MRARGARRRLRLLAGFDEDDAARCETQARPGTYRRTAELQRLGRDEASLALKPSHMKAEMHDLRSVSGTKTVPADEPRRCCTYSELQERSACRMAAPRIESGKPSCAVSASSGRIETLTETSPAEGRFVWHSPRSCSASELLLLDEPTNHLDLEVRNWSKLSRRLSNAVILVPDRYFLDDVVTRSTTSR